MGQQKGFGNMKGISEKDYDGVVVFPVVDHVLARIT
jgi:hypothetical protein